MPTSSPQRSPATANRLRWSDAPWWSRTIGLLAGALLFFGVVRVYWRDSADIFPHRLQLEVVFPKGSAGTIEPLVTTGRFEAGDFLTVKYLDEENATISYDAWGLGGPTSAPFTLQPGVRHKLEIAMPSLPLFWESSNSENGNLRVQLDGREAIDATVRFHERLQREIYFAENPIGGTPARSFHGELYDATGARLTGKVSRAAPLPMRWQWIAQRFWLELLVALLASTWLGRFAARFTAKLPDRVGQTTAIANGGVHHTFLVVAIICTLLFTAFLTGGTFRVRTEDAFASFYDYQAASLLHGKLNVPEKAIDGEAFVVQGKYYGYFGPTPALLRLPFAIAGVGFAKLTRIFLIAYYAASLAATYLLLRQAVRSLRGRTAVPSRWTVVIALVSVGIGSTLFFLGSRAYIYHEAALSGAAFALWSVWFALRYLERPSGQSWMGALVCGAASIHARPTSGLFALCTIGMVALLLLTHHLFRERNRTDTNAPTTRVGAARMPLAVGLLVVLAILSFNGMSYLKFRTFDGAPLRYHIQYHAERLANIGGKNFHLSNLRHNVDVYLRLPAFHFERRFPWFFLGGTLREYPEARIDLDEPTLALPFAMPALCCCAVLGGAWAAFVTSSARRTLGLLVVAALPMMAALCMAVATSHRYTADFCPLLIAGAMWGLAAWDTSRWRKVLLSLITLLLALTVAITPAIALQYQRAGVWGVPDDIRRHDDRFCRYFDRLFGVQ